MNNDHLLKQIAACLAAPVADLGPRRRRFVSFSIQNTFHCAVCEEGRAWCGGKDGWIEVLPLPEIQP
jgi:hypothetical protein